MKRTTAKLPALPDRGRLLTPAMVASQKFAGAVSPRWVRENVQPRVKLGHNTVMFYEQDVDQWIASRREAPEGMC